MHKIASMESQAAEISRISVLESPYSIKCRITGIRLQFSLRHSRLLYRPSVAICHFGQVMMGSVRKQIEKLGR
jgi:hypothetical protein